MTTTFKTFAIAAMMTVFGAATGFANNTNHKFNNKHPQVTHVTQVNMQNKQFMKEYEMAKRCKCKACKEFVKKVEKHMKDMMKNKKNQCHCEYCKTINHASVVYSNNYNYTGKVKSGRH